MSAPRHPDSAQLTRQWSLLRLLSTPPRTYTVKELADQLQTSKSSIERDLATLEKAFGLVEEAAGKQKKRYRLAETIQGLESIRFGLLELLALHAARTTIHFTAGTPFHDDLRNLIGKIRGHLSDRHNSALDAMARVFQHHPRRSVNYAPFSEVIETLVDAIARNQRCHATYQTAWREEPGNYDVRPLKLLFHDGAIYLLAQLNRERTIKVLAVHRFMSLTATNQRFPPPRSDLDAVTRKAFGVFIGSEEEEVEVVFDRKIARMVGERTFHPDEEKERLPDGRLRFRLKTAARWEVVSWVLRHGDAAELVKPAAWREDIVRAAEALLERHRAPAAPSSGGRQRRPRT